jgi:enoyl-CoA hydratase
VTAGKATAPIGIDELRVRVRASIGNDLGPLGASPCMLVLLDEPAPVLEANEQAAIARWLRRRPCPVIGIGIGDGGAVQTAALREACDTVVAAAADAAPLVDNIERSPLAAMTLVQVLRVTERLDIDHALVVESLAYSTLQTGPEFRRWLEQRRPSAGARARDEGPAVVVERCGDRCEIRLNRPGRRNAFSVEMRDALCEALEFVVADPSVLEVGLSGNGRCFSSGGDLDEFGTKPDPATAHAVRSLRLPARLLAQRASRITARVHGTCIGAGAELPAFAHRVHATRDASFALPELAFGLIPGAGGCVSLPRRIGRHRTAGMALSGARIDAQQALAWGLVDAIVD